MRRAILFGIAALAALALSSAQDGVLLRHDLKENAQDVYKVEMKGNQVIQAPGIDDQPVDVVSTMTCTFKTGKLDAEKGEAELELVTSDIKVEVEGPMAGMVPTDQIPKETTGKGKVDRRYRFTMEPAGQGGMMAMLGGGMNNGLGFAIELPEKAVKPGDVWVVTLPKNPAFGDKEIPLNAKLEGERIIDEVPCYEISMQGVVPLDLDSEKAAKSLPPGGADTAGGMRVLVKGDLNVKMVGYYEKSTCRLVRFELETSGKQKIELPDIGIVLDSSGTSKMAMSLQK